MLVAAVGGTPRDVTQPARGWDDDAWSAAAEGLRRRGLVDADGAATSAGRALHAEVEATTDARALEPWARLSADDLESVTTTLARLAGHIAASGVIRSPNPMGLPLST